MRSIRAGLENRVRHEVATGLPHGPRDGASKLVLRRLQRFSIRSETTSCLDDKEITQLDLALTDCDAAFFDQPLRTREYAACRKELDRHIGEALELLLSLHDVRAIDLNDALGDRV